MNPINGSFSKKFRIRNKHEIDSLFSNGNSFISYPFRVIFIISEQREGFIKILISVPKAKIKTAVTRNRIKRMTRESFRLQKESVLNVLDQKKLGISLALIYIPTKLLKPVEVNKGIIKLMDKLTEIAVNNKLN